MKNTRSGLRVSVCNPQNLCRTAFPFGEINSNTVQNLYDPDNIDIKPRKAFRAGKINNGR